MNTYMDNYSERIKIRELWLQYCPRCCKSIFYPRAFCPGCLQGELEWRRVTGRGIIYSYTVVYVSALPEFASMTPYIYALIELEEGVRMASNLVGCSLENVEVGMPVEISWAEKNGHHYPVFKPALKDQV